MIDHRVYVGDQPAGPWELIKPKYAREKVDKN